MKGREVICNYVVLFGFSFCRASVLVGDNNIA